MVMMFKFRHGLCGCILDDIGLSVVYSVTRGANVHILQQTPSNNIAASKFTFRATSNSGYSDKLPTAIISLHSLDNF